MNVGIYVDGEWNHYRSRARTRAIRKVISLELEWGGTEGDKEGIMQQ